MKGFLRRCFLIFMVMLLAGGCARQKETESVTKESDGQEKVMRYVNYSMFFGRRPESSETERQCRADDFLLFAGRTYAGVSVRTSVRNGRPL